MAVNNRNDSNRICLKVLTQDKVIHQFRIRNTTPLRKLMIAYCTKTGNVMGTVRFFYGRTLLRNTDTPLSLKMKEGDRIRSYKSQLGD